MCCKTNRPSVFLSCVRLFTNILSDIGGLCPLKADCVREPSEHRIANWQAVYFAMPLLTLFLLRSNVIKLSSENTHPWKKRQTISGLFPLLLPWLGILRDKRNDIDFLTTDFLPGITGCFICSGVGLILSGSTGLS